MFNIIMVSVIMMNAIYAECVYGLCHSANLAGDCWSNLQHRRL
jgi:hypothetical protein